MPSYTDLNFTEEEQQIIDAAWIEGKLAWSSEAMMPIRAKIRNLHRVIQGDMCCYCRKNFQQDHPLAVDVEHVLPQAIFRMIAIAPVNMSVACKRCNLSIKGEKYDFIFGADVVDVVENLEASNSYEIIHPNLDSYADHIEVAVVRIPGLVFHRYRALADSPKAHKTIDFFRLRDLEVDELDAAQGIPGAEGEHRSAKIRALLEI